MAAWEGMTPAELIDDLGHAIAERYRRIADALEDRLRTVLEQAIDAPPDLVTRLRVARELEQQARTLVETMKPDKIARIVTEIISGEASAEISRQLMLIPSLSGSVVTAGGLYAVAAAEIDLRDDLRALNARILRAPADLYQRMTATTVVDVLIGRSTWQQLQRRQVDQYLAGGITGFVDKSGRNWRIGSYAEMATRTAAARAWRDQSVASMATAGIETFTPIIGNDACANCAAWAGRVLTEARTEVLKMVPHAITGEPTALRIDGTLEQARAAGWGHPNCRCVLGAALPGLDRSNATTHDPEREAARDKLRELERDVREAKRNGTPEEIGEAQAALRKHVQDTGATRRPFREQLPFADGGDMNPRGRTMPTTPPRAPDGPGPRISTPGDAGAQLRIARKAIERVHAFPDVRGPEVQLKVFRTRGMQGRYMPALERIEISRTGMHQALTLVHEYGHHLDHLLGGAQTLRMASSGAHVGPWRDFFTAVNASPEIEQLRQLRTDPRLNDGQRKHVGYLLHRSETWARAYAQYIAGKSRSKSLRDGVRRMLEAENPLTANRQWSRASFAPISETIDEILREAGWLK
ncbi:phage minor capsid protein [Leucobacter luti]|uniref:phage minor capsid protein n=1 Tax=Leucobacter luti TaxID=340320 RepID=UPI003D06E20A